MRIWINLGGCKHIKERFLFQSVTLSAYVRLRPFHCFDKAALSGGCSPTRTSPHNLYKLWNRLASGSYFPPPVRRVDITNDDGRTRPLGIPTVADRVARAVSLRLRTCIIVQNC